MQKLFAKLLKICKLCASHLYTPETSFLLIFWPNQL